MDFWKDKRVLIGVGVLLVLIALFVQVKLFVGSQNSSTDFVRDTQGLFNAAEAVRADDGRIRITLAYPIIASDNQVADKIAVYYDVAKPTDVAWSATFPSVDNKGMVFWLPATYANTGWHANFFHGTSHDAADAKFFLKPERWIQPGYAVRGLVIRRAPGGFCFFADVQ